MGYNKAEFLVIMIEGEQNIGVISEVAHDNETQTLLHGAKDILRRIINEEADTSELDEFIESSGNASFLTHRHPQLKGDSPLAALRKEVDREQTQEIMTRQQTPKPEPYRQIEHHFDADEEPLRRFIVVSTQGDLEYLTENTRAVHLVRQELINLGSISRILDTCPNLQAIQLPPSHHARLISHSLKDLLEEHDVEIRKGRVQDYKYYDQYPKLTSFTEKAEVFKNMLQNSEKGAIYEQMRHFNFVEVEISELYFGEKRMTIREIAKELGMRPSKVQVKLSGLLDWAGYPSNFFNAKSSISVSLKRLKKLMAAEIDKKN